MLGAEIMPAGGHCARRVAQLLLGVALGASCLHVMAGCGGGPSGTKPAEVGESQAKKAQEYMAGYREQMVADNKAKAKAKKESGKKSP